ncbi:MAG: MFS transporter [Proteobacteria bacterium]|nr:MFS transporter [Pseudomonadota bacterium]
MSGGRVFHGWFVVAAAFVITFVGFGSAYTFSSFLDSLQSDLGASRGSASLVFCFAAFLYFGLGVISAPLAERWGARKLAATGMALVGAGLILAGRARTLDQVYVAYSFGIGLGVGCAYVPTLAVVQRWFVERRGLASGFAVSGIGVGTLIMPPVATTLIDSIGWRNAYLALGVFALVLGIAATFSLEDNPAARNLHPDGIRPTPGAAQITREGLSLRQAVGTRSFVSLYGACLVASLGVFVPFVHLVPYAADHGILASTAAWLLSAIGIGSTIGRFFLGGIADKMGRKRFLVIMYLGMAASLTIWTVAQTVLLLVLFALIFGLFYGGWVAILPAVVADLFGAKNVGAIIGVLYTSVGIGSLIGPSSVGFLYDVSRSYGVAIGASAAANVIAAALAAMVVRR